MYAHTVNYRKRDGGQPGQLVNLGFFVHGLPRLMLPCRAVGHRPVVDGTPAARVSGGYVGQAYLWVVCARCGVRGEPQGSLDPHLYRIGWRYRGPWGPVIGQDAMAAVKADLPWLYPPGPIERKPTGTLGGQLVIGRCGLTDWGWEVKVGHRGSDHTLAVSVAFGPLGRLYLHTERFGEGIARLLNPDRAHTYQSKMTGFSVGDGRVRWRLWAGRDSDAGQPIGQAWNWVAGRLAQMFGFTLRRARVPRSGRGELVRWWRHGQISLRWLDIVLGPRMFQHTPMGETARLVRMPEGDYLVHLELNRVQRGRKRGRKPVPQPWTVRWQAMGMGIPDRPSAYRGPVSAAAVTVSQASVDNGTWPAEATAAIIVQITRMRTGHGWEPTGVVKVEQMMAPVP